MSYKKCFSNRLAREKWCKFHLLLFKEESLILWFSWILKTVFLWFKIFFLSKHEIISSVFNFDLTFNSACCLHMVFKKCDLIWMIYWFSLRYSLFDRFLYNCCIQLRTIEIQCEFVGYWNENNEDHLWFAW